MKYCHICEDSYISQNTKCDICKKSVCINCYCKICNLSEENDVIDMYSYEYCCPFCRTEKKKKTEDLSAHNVINLLSTNFNKALSYIKKNYDEELFFKIQLIKELEFKNERYRNIIEENKKNEKRIETYKSITEYYKKKNLELEKENFQLKNSTNDQNVIKKIKDFFIAKKRKTVRLEDFFTHFTEDKVI